jgi:hypothetical protein
MIANRARVYGYDRLTVQSLDLPVSLVEPESLL